MCFELRPIELFDLQNIARWCCGVELVLQRLRRLYDAVRCIRRFVLKSNAIRREQLDAMYRWWVEAESKQRQRTYSAIKSWKGKQHQGTHCPKLVARYVDCFVTEDVKQLTVYAAYDACRLLFYDQMREHKSKKVAPLPCPVTARTRALPSRCLCPCPCQPLLPPFSMRLVTLRPTPCPAPAVVRSVFPILMPLPRPPHWSHRDRVGAVEGCDYGRKTVTRGVLWSEVRNALRMLVTRHSRRQAAGKQGDGFADHSGPSPSALTPTTNSQSMSVPALHGPSIFGIQPGTFGCVQRATPSSSGSSQSYLLAGIQPRNIPVELERFSELHHAHPRKYQRAALLSLYGNFLRPQSNGE